MFTYKTVRLLSITAALAMAAPTARIVAAQQPAETSIPDKVRLFIPYKDYTAEENTRILEMYKWLRVADVSDALPFLDNITRERYIKETGMNPWAKKPGGGK